MPELLDEFVAELSIELMAIDLVTSPATGGTDIPENICKPTSVLPTCGFTGGLKFENRPMGGGNNTSGEVCVKKAPFAKTLRMDS